MYDPYTVNVKTETQRGKVTCHGHMARMCWHPHPNSGTLFGLRNCACSHIDLCKSNYVIPSCTTFQKFALRLHTYWPQRLKPSFSRYSYILLPNFIQVSAQMGPLSLTMPFQKSSPYYSFNLLSFSSCVLPLHDTTYYLFV